MGVATDAAVLTLVERVSDNMDVAAPAQRKGERMAWARACGSGIAGSHDADDNKCSRSRQGSEQAFVTIHL